MRVSWRPQTTRLVNEFGTSPLYQLTPRGLGTAAVESLSSYAARLAAEHCVPLHRLLKHYVVRPLRRDRGTATPPQCLGPGINGDTPMTEGYLICLEAATWAPEIRHTAFHGRVPGLFIGRSYRLMRAWCVECLREDNIPYDRLAWSLKAYQTCVTHDRPLVDVCARCERSHQPLVAGAAPNACGWCEAPLSAGPLPRSRNAQRRDELVLDLITLLEQGRVVGRRQVVAGMTHFIRKVGGRHAATTRLPNVNPATVKCVRDDSKSTQLEVFLEFVEASGETLDRFLRHEYAPLVPARSYSTGPRKRDLSHLEPEVRALLDAGRDEELPTVLQLARRFGVNENNLASRVPSMTEYISRRAAVRTRRRQERERAELEDVLTEARTLYAERGSITNHQLAKRLKNPAVFMKPATRIAIAELKRELMRTEEEAA